MNECLFFTTQFFSNSDKQKLANCLVLDLVQLLLNQTVPKNVDPFTKPLMQLKMYAKIKA